MPWVSHRGEAVSGGASFAPRRKQARGKGQGKHADSNEDWRVPQSSSDPVAQRTGHDQQAVRADPVSDQAESTSMHSSPKASTTLSSAVRPLGAMKPRRMAWADMASDDSGSEGADLLQQHPASPSSASAVRSKPEDAQDPKAQQPDAAGQVEPETPEEHLNRWITRVLVMAENMQEIAAEAPHAAEPQRFCEAVGTEASIADVARWEASALELTTVQSEIQQVQTEKAEVDAALKETELVHKREDTLAADQAVQLAEEEASRVQQDQCDASEFAEVTECHAAAATARDMLTRQANVRAEKQEAVLQALRQRLADETATAVTAEAEAARNFSTRQARLALPEWQRRLEASKADAEKSEAACSVAKSGISQLRSDLAAAMGAADSRAAKLEARRLQLEGESNRLQQSLAEFTQAGVSAAAEKAEVQKLEENLNLAQNKNREALEHIRKVRASRDEAKADMESLHAEIAESKSAHRRADIHGSDVIHRTSDRAERTAAAREEVDRLKKQIEQSEQESNDLQEMAKHDQARQADVESAKRELQRSQQRGEGVATVLEHRLQKTAMQLERTQPGSYLVKHLINSDGKGGIGLQRPAQSKKTSAGGQVLFASAHGNGSDLDLESSTAASETLVECGF